MDSNRWERVQNLFHLTADLPEDRRRITLERECVDDPLLIGEVLTMIERDNCHAGVLDQTLSLFADDVFRRTGDLAPKQIGPYEIQSVLGEGGMGTVFFAVRKDLGTPAAIKILRDSWLSPARRERFAREQYTLARLDHPNIARLLDASTLESGAPYFVMEYVEGVHLDEYCKMHLCGLAERLRLFRSVCEAVQFAHRHTIIHRDLKPSNVMVKADGTVKLLDFGIARQNDEFSPQTDATRTGLRFMTPAFAAPEQLRGEPSTVGADVYSLGVILYSLLTGKLPFDQQDLGARVISLAAGSPVVRPSLAVASAEEQQVPAAVSKSDWVDLDVIVLTAMHEDVRQRYSSAEALIRDVDRYLEGEPLEARPDAVLYRLRKFFGRHKVAVLLTTAALIAASTLITFFMTRLAAERNAAIAEAARTQRVQQFMRNLFQGGDSDAGPSKDLRVAALLDRGVLEARAFDKDPGIQAELFQTLAEIYAKLGNFSQADELFAAALKLRRSASPNSAAIVEITTDLALLRMDQAKLDEAQQLGREALAMSRRDLPPGHPAIAFATDAVGRVLEEKGAYAEAIDALQEAVRLRSGAHQPSAGLAGSLYELANAYFYTGRYKESQALNLRVLKMNREVYGERHPRVAETLVNLGAIQQELGNYPDAERLHRQALAITRAFFGDMHYRTAAGFTLVARALVYQKRFDEAVVLLKQALAIQERVFGAVHPRVASVLNDLGSVALQRSDFAEAKLQFTRMADIYRQVYAGRHYLMGTALSNLGSTYMAEKNNAQAERLFREAISIFETTLSPNHLNTAIARVKLGRSLLRQKSFRQAEAETFSGYGILKKQMNPSVTWLNSARADLAEIYLALGENSKAAEYSRELRTLKRQ